MAEEALKTVYPQCNFLGVDPDSKINKELFDELGGTFVQAAIAGKTGISEISKLNRGLNFESKYLYSEKIQKIKS